MAEQVVATKRYHWDELWREQMASGMSWAQAFEIHVFAESPYANMMLRAYQSQDLASRYRRLRAEGAFKHGEKTAIIRELGQKYNWSTSEIARQLFLPYSTVWRVLGGPNKSW
jgi:transcriptional regulator of acetoin/glycerol metabolism